MNAIAQSTFNPSLAVINGTIKTTSLKVAEHFGKRHDRVLRAINNLECSPEFTESNFGVSEYKDASGKSNPYYEMTKDGFTFLAMGFTGKEAAKWKEAYINAFNKMAEQLSSNPVQLESQDNSSPYITEFEAYQFNKSIKAHCKRDRKAFSDAYNCLYEYYKITTYKHIPAGCLKEAAQIICGFNLIDAGCPPVTSPALTHSDVIKMILEIRDQDGDETIEKLRNVIRQQELEKIGFEFKNRLLSAKISMTIDNSEFIDVRLS